MLMHLHRARATDPASSHAAALRAAKFACSHAGRILAALREGGEMTAHGISEATGLTVVQIDRRTVELQRKGRIAVVKDANGDDLVVDGYRVWKAV